MMRKMLFIFVLVFLIVSVSGLGISPGKSTFIYKEGGLGEGSVRIFNSDGLEKTVDISVTGEIKDFIILDTWEIDFNEGEEVKQIGYKMMYDPSLEEGSYTGNIIFREEGSGEGLIQTNIELESQVVLIVPGREKGVLESNLDNAKDFVQKEYVAGYVKDQGYLYTGLAILAIIFIISLARFLSTHKEHKKLVR